MFDCSPVVMILRSVLLATYTWSSQEHAALNILSNLRHCCPCRPWNGLCGTLDWVSAQAAQCRHDTSQHRQPSFHRVQPLRVGFPDVAKAELTTIMAFLQFLVLASLHGIIICMQMATGITSTVDQTRVHMHWSSSTCEPVCGAGANKYHEQILPLLLDVCQSPEASLRQSALYGLGTVAQHQPHLFQTIAADAISRIGQVIAAPNSR